MKPILLLEAFILLAGQMSFAGSNDPLDARELNRMVVVALSRDTDFIKAFSDLISSTRAGAAYAAYVLDFVNNVAKCDETETLPAKWDLHLGDPATGRREFEYSEFGYRLFLPWGPPTEYRTVTNKDHNVTLGMSYSSGVIVNLFDLTSQGTVCEFLSNDNVSAMFRLASADDLLVSQRRLWLEAMHASAGQLTPTNTPQQVARAAALLVVKRGFWPFKTRNLYEFNVPATGISGFQIGSPEKDAMVYLEMFDKSGRHATVVIRPQEKAQKTLPLNQEEVNRIILSFRVLKKVEPTKADFNTRAR